MRCICMCTDTRMDIYVRPEDRKKIVKKAQAMGISVSWLIVSSTLGYDITQRENSKVSK